MLSRDAVRGPLVAAMWERVARVLAVSVLVLGALISIDVTTSPATAATPFQCNDMYAVGEGVVYGVKPEGGKTTAFGTFKIGGSVKSVNGLGITADGRYAYGVVGGRIYRYNAVNEQTVDVGATPATANSGITITHGAINPATGIYYYGGFRGSGSNRVLEVYGFNPASGGSIGLVASGPVPNQGASGDWAFDANGSLYVIGGDGSTGNNTLAVVSQKLPTVAGTVMTISGAKQLTQVNGTEAINGIGFSGDGYLYLASGSKLYKANPATGALIGAAVDHTVSNSVDLASCANPNTIVVQKDFPSGRVAPSHQVRLSLQKKGDATTTVTADTTGNATGIQAETAGPLIGFGGTTYQFTETGTGTTAPSSSTPGYTNAWRCVDASRNDALVAQGNGTSGEVTLPGGGAAIVCTFTNTRKQTGLSLVKSAGAINDVNNDGRHSAGDRITYTFTVTNTGTVPLDTVSVADPKVGPVTCPSGALAVGATRTCTATYTLTQADVDAGKIDNTATATGTATGLPGATATDTVSTAITRAADIRLSKSHVANGPIKVGTTLDYTFRVVNTGNVTLTGIAITDPVIGSVTCPVTTLAPGEATTCTGSYTLTQSDFDNEQVDNTATVTGNKPGGGTVTDTDTDSFTDFPTDGRLDLKKTATLLDGGVDLDDRIGYSFTVTNTGPNTINGLVIIDPTIGAVTCSATTLAPGGSTTCTATTPHTITQADVDDGGVTNTAIASGKDPKDRTVESAPASATVPIERTPEITLVKNAAVTDTDGSGLVDAGDTVTYTFTAKNTGNVTLTGVAVTDPTLGTVTCTPTTLAPGQSANCTAADYVITTDDHGTTLVNTATVAGNPPTGGPVTATASATTQVATPVPGIKLVKTAAAPVDQDGSGLVDAGDTITYSFRVTNTGNVPLSGVTLADPMLTNVTCPKTTLDAGESITCTADDYTITTADQGKPLTNTATVTATPPTGAAVTDTSRTTTAVDTPRPSIALTKTAADPVDVNNSGLTDAGDTIAYTFTVTNTGNVPLTNVTLDDLMLTGITCPVTTLDPGGSMTCIANDYVIGVDDHGGDLTNTATVTGTPPTGAPVTDSSTTATTVGTPRPQLTLVKTAGAPTDVNDSGITDAGDTILYTFVVTNTGNVPVGGVGIDDALLAAQTPSIAVNCPSTTLAPGASIECVAAAPYPITVADEDAKKVTNTAIATGTDPNHDGVTSNTSSVTTDVIKPNPWIVIDKVAGAPVDVNGSGITDAGDTIGYTFTVTNQGNVPMHDVSIVDPTLTGGTPGLTITCSPTTLGPGESTSCATSEPYVITRADVAAGSVVNTARATALDPNGQSTDSLPDSTSTPTTTPVATLALVKKASEPTDVNGSGITDAGDTIVYTFTVTNTGNVPLKSLRISDARFASGEISCPVTTVAAGESTTCTSQPYVVSAADVAAGNVQNVAVATGEDPDGGQVTSPQSRTNTPTTQPLPTLAITKHAGVPVDVNGSEITDAGDTIAYTFTVTNTGNVPITSVAVTDAKLATQGITVTCSPDTLAPGASATCTTSKPYSVTVEDQDSGSVANAATATGVDPDGLPVASPPATSTTPTVKPQPLLTIEKTAGTPTDVNGSGITDAGDTVVYSFVVTNAGNVPIRDISVDDPKLAGQGISTTCTPSVLDPGEDATCTTSAAYVITADDVREREAVNEAIAGGLAPGTGTGPGVPTTSAPDRTTTPTKEPFANLTVVKTAGTPVDVNASGLVDAGDTIAYTFTVTNTGNVPIHGLTINDAKIGSAIQCDATTIAVGAVVECHTTTPYVVTTADQGAGVVHNTATAAGNDPDGGDVTSAPDTASVPVDHPSAGLMVTKTAAAPVDVNASGLVDAGDTIEYTFTITNTGNVPLTDVAVDDPMLTAAGAAITCPALPGGVLEPGATLTCTSAPYEITGADVDAGSVTNSATATGTPPGEGTTPGDPIDSPPDTTTTTTTTPEPGIVIDKVAGTPVDVNGSGITDAGDTVVYTFTVTNVGNVPMTGITVNDPMLDAAGVGITCPTPVGFILEIGQSITCTSDPYAVTTDDVDAGAVQNTATATATDPDGGTTTGPSDPATVPTTAPDPSLLTLKSASKWRRADGSPVEPGGVAAVGDIITFAFSVRNTGNVPLTVIRIEDTMLSDTPIECLEELFLLPGEEAACVSDRFEYILTQDDIDRGFVHNDAVGTAADPDGKPVESPPTDTTTALDQDPRLTLVKTVDRIDDVNRSGITDEGDRIVFSFEVTNTGNVTVTDVGIADDLLDNHVPTLSITCDWESVAREFDPSTDTRTDDDAGDGNLGPAIPGMLIPNASVTCLSDPYPISAADAAAGNVINVATAYGDVAGSGDMVHSEQSTAAVNTRKPQPKLVVDKRAGTPTDVNKSGLTDAGDTVVYTFTVTNAGNVPMTDVSINDVMLTGAGGSITCATPPGGALAPGAAMTCISTPYVITPADVEAGAVHNVATATGTPPGPGTTPGTPIEGPEDGTSVPTTMPQPELAIAKTAREPIDLNGSGLVDAGDRIVYDFTVTNTGNVPLTDVEVIDPMLAGAGVTITCDVTTLAPGDHTVCVSEEYAITAADVTGGAVTNSATAGAEDPDGNDVESPVDVSSTPTTMPEPHLVVDKSAGTPTDVNSSGITDAGDTVVYTFTVTNTGNVPLTQVEIDDPMLHAAGVAITCPALTDGVLAVGASVTCTSGPYRITSADVAAGAAINSAMATATPPSEGVVPGTPVESPPDTTSTPTTAPRPALMVVKEVAGVEDVNSSGITDAPDEIRYAFTVTNMGNVPVHGIAIDDPLLAGTTITCDDTVLGVGEQTSCVAQDPYVVTKADERTGNVHNSAIATGSDPDGRDVDSPPDTATVPTTEAFAGMKVVKTAAAPVDVNNSGITDAGDTIGYTFTVTNTGNVPLYGVAIDDRLLSSQSPPIGVTCDVTTLAVGEQAECVADASYIVTKADERAGHVYNSATATAKNPNGGDVESPPATTMTPTELAEPGLQVVKDATLSDTNGSGNTDHGDTIVYTFTVTNTGNVPLTAIQVNDPMLADAGVTVGCQALPGGVLAVGAHVVCESAEYTVTEADERTGAIVNSATAAAEDPNGDDVESGRSTHTVPTTPAAPALSLAKRAADPVDVNDNGLIDAGDTIAYTFIVTNTGNVPITDLSVDDPMLTAAGISVSCNPTTLAAGASVTCAASEPYRITQADVDTGGVRNRAVAGGLDPWRREVTPPTDSTTTMTSVKSELTLQKRAGDPVDANGTGQIDAGDTITFSFVVTNTGTLSIHNVAINDPMLVGLDITCGATSLAAGEQTTCVAEPYVVTQADIDSGSVDNTAWATGNSPGGWQGDPDQASAKDSTSTPLTRTSSMTLKKTATLRDRDGDNRADVGEEIDYRFAVTNTGNTQLSSVRIVDAMLSRAAVAITCARTELAPGESTVCAATYTVRAADLRDGEVVNVATAKADSSAGGVTSRPSTAKVKGGKGHPGGGLADTGGVPAVLPFTGLILVAVGLILIGAARRRGEA